MYDAEGAAYRRRQSARYLNSVRRAREHVEALNAEIEQHRSLASGLSGIDYTVPMVDASPAADAMADAVARLLEVIAERVAAVRDYVAMLDECSAALDAMGGREADLLRLHYLSGKSLACIGEMDTWMHDRQYMSVLHRAALERFADYIPFSQRDPRPCAV